MPLSTSAEMSVDGYRCERPNPAMPTLAPSSMSATASAADAITLLNGSSCQVCLTIQSVSTAATSALFFSSIIACPLP